MRRRSDTRRALISYAAALAAVASVAAILVWNARETAQPNPIIAAPTAAQNPSIPPAPTPASSSPDIAKAVENAPAPAPASSSAPSSIDPPPPAAPPAPALAFGFTPGRPNNLLAEPENNPEPALLDDDNPAPVDVPKPGSLHPDDPRSSALAEYETRKASIPDDPESHLKLSQWCDDKGLWPQSREQAEAILKLVPDHSIARKRLGFSRGKGGHWIENTQAYQARLATQAQKFWFAELARLHKRMHAAGPKGDEQARHAVAAIMAVNDPHVVPALWEEFADDARHHLLMVQKLAEFPTETATKYLVGAAIYSMDPKAGSNALEALVGRDPRLFAPSFVSLLITPIRVEKRDVDMPDGSRVPNLFLDDGHTQLEMLFPAYQQPGQEQCGIGYNARMNRFQIQEARDFNKRLEAMGRAQRDQQVERMRLQVEQRNQQIRTFNGRVTEVLNQLCGTRLNPQDPEDPRRWLAQLMDFEYIPPERRPRVFNTKIVEPLERPPFLPVAART